MATLGSPFMMLPGLTAQSNRQPALPPSLKMSPISSGLHEKATFCFVDIAGYTALTDSHGELAAANLIEEFNELIRIAVESMGQIQELTGDCAFLVFRTRWLQRMRLRLSTSWSLIARTSLLFGPDCITGRHCFGEIAILVRRSTSQRELRHRQSEAKFYAPKGLRRISFS